MITNVTKAQIGQVGVNTSAPKSTLDVQAETTTPGKAEGIIAPRLAGAVIKSKDADYGSAQTGAIVYATSASPDAGLAGAKTINIDDTGYYYFDGTVWQAFIRTPEAGWMLDGNSIADTNFLGTINNKALIFKVNNQRAGHISNLEDPAINVTTGNNAKNWTAFGYLALDNIDATNTTNENGNSAFGYQALTNAAQNVNHSSAFGYQALAAATGSPDSVSSNSSAFGYRALAHSTVSGGGSSAFGSRALENNTTGSNNAAFGTMTLNANSTGRQNSAFGDYALSKNIGGALGTTQFGNSAFGYNALLNNTSGNANSAFGASALQGNITGNSSSAFGANALLNFGGTGNNTAIGMNALRGGAGATGSGNTAVGVGALNQTTSGYDNTALGNNALNGNTTGYQNSAFGILALRQNTTGFGNVGVGRQTLNNNTTGHFNTGIGVNAGYGFGGSNNVAIGYGAGSGTSSNNSFSGNYNIVIGSLTGNLAAGSLTSVDSVRTTLLSSPTASNEMNIGNTLFGTGVNQVAGDTRGITNPGLWLGKIGINTRKPGAPLDVTKATSAATDPIMKLHYPAPGASSDNILTWNPADSSVRMISAITFSSGGLAYTAGNGLTLTGSNQLELGGTLTKPTSIITDTTNTLAITGLQNGALTDSVVTVDAGGTLRKVSTVALSYQTLGMPIRSVTTAGTIFTTDNDYTIVAAGLSGTPQSVTLPTAAGVKGKVYNIISTNPTSGGVPVVPTTAGGSTSQIVFLTSSGIVHLGPGGSAASFILKPNANIGLTVQSDGTDWILISTASQISGY
ncbi:hypothetical protein [Fluviicola sp.]|uniref:beta strand repeat-containing protein n=1 Tax=Fluviicola sp. TaxID=1917219 RepID=UPI00283613E4|nr:hypothetical protein [Fluviicola sp.]MDR0803259.1 hypothetical protein [Fluviicola sp.]